MESMAERYKEAVRNNDEKTRKLLAASMERQAAKEGLKVKDLANLMSKPSKADLEALKKQEEGRQKLQKLADAYRKTKNPKMRALLEAAIKKEAGAQGAKADDLLIKAAMGKDGKIDMARLLTGNSGQLPKDWLGIAAINGDSRDAKGLTNRINGGAKDQKSGQQSNAQAVYNMAGYGLVRGTKDLDKKLAGAEASVNNALAILNNALGTTLGSNFSLTG